MKIITEGDPRKALPWWTRVVWKCTRCGFSAEFDETDAIRVKVHYGQRDDLEGASATCPTCGKAIFVYPDGRVR